MREAHPGPPSRRSFLQALATGATLAALPSWARASAGADEPVSRGAAAAAGETWFRRAARWGQTNLTEVDPRQFDLAWWRTHWRRTRIQGVVINAGGIVAYYPTEIPQHRRAAHLGDRDLLGELTRAAREDGLAVFARMDSNRADQAFYDANPDWFAHDADGKPYRVTDLPVACVNSPYYDEHIPAVLREVATRYRPDGFTDNNWNGPMRHQPCHCPNCQSRFRARTGESIPRTADWNSPIYREWILWNYERRLEIWDLFNRTTRAAGGPTCLWVGMMAGSQNWQSRVFRDDREIYRRTEMIMLDHQRRFDAEGFQHNGETAKRLLSVGGWDKLVPESMAMYHLSEHNFRLAMKPSPEVRLWAVDGFAGGVQPWWHHVGSDQQDRRMLETAVPLWQWHAQHERFLRNRLPVAAVGLLWTQRNMDFFGRDHGTDHVDDPWNGFTQSLVRARIPYVPVHVDDLERLVMELKLRVLILPNLAALADNQVDAVRRFAEAGGSLVATGLSTLCDQWGDPRPDFALGDLFGVHLPSSHPWRNEPERDRWASEWAHTYLRLLPEQRGVLEGPRTGSEPVRSGDRPPILDGFEQTDLLAFGGRLAPLRVDPGCEVHATYVPPVPIAPAESVWMREPVTEIPAVVTRLLPGGGRSVYLAADLDRRYARERIPDQARLLANAVRWAAAEPAPLEVTGPGLLDCHLWQQGSRRILHIVNLSHAGAWRTPVDELIPVGPLSVAVRSTESFRSARSLVTEAVYPLVYAGGTWTLEVPRVLDHEVIVLDT